ncbi:MAG: zinc ribbon domain-containing protein [Candidatus Aenigmarchaeota archaeon]|nr:zinc ribbon domain-containing protein [Candidatus Aenigmarchaeota archaeon]
MRCEICDTKLNKKWRFCPNCGIMIGSSDLVEFFNRQIKFIAQKFEEMDEEFEIPKNITITLTPVGINQEKPKIINSKPIKMPKDVIEPEMSMKKLANELIFYIKLPGVKKIEDVNLQIFSNSIEVRAVAGNKGYFKIINIPPRYSLVNKRLSDEELILHFNYF